MIDIYTEDSTNLDPLSEAQTICRSSGDCLRYHKERCDTTGDCAAYQTTLVAEDARIDRYIESANQSAATTGIIIGLIGLIIVLTPFVHILRRLMASAVPKLAIIAPIATGIIVGLFAGFLVSFGTCFKQDCSIASSSAIVTIPAATLLITVPITRFIYRKRHNMTVHIGNSGRVWWVALGVIVIAGSITYTLSRIESNNRSGIADKQYLREFNQ